MAALTGNAINTSYQGLLKTADNGALSATEKALTDGLGNNSTLTIGTASASFSGTLDLSGATVTGLPSGSAGLENGTGLDSLQSASSLTTVAANAAGNDSIALGDSSSATRADSIAIGNGATANGGGGDGSIAIGKGSSAGANKSIAIGINGTTSSSEGIVIGDNVDMVSSDRGIAIGNAINISGAPDSITLGTQTNVSGNSAIAIGRDASATASQAIALGRDVIAATANTLSVKALETQTDSTPTAGGIIMSDASGTNRRLNINATGGLQVDSTVVGGGDFESPLSPARKYQTTANNKWNFAMPQDGNNYDGGGLQALIDVSNTRRFFTQIYSDTVTEFAILVGDGYTGSFRVELFDSHASTGMPNSVIASTTSFTAGSTGAGLTWYTGSFTTTQTLNYEQYYIAITGINADAAIYCGIGAGGYINRLVEINPAAHPASTGDAVEYIGGGMNSTGTAPLAVNHNFGFRIDAFQTILFKQ
mgnify:CR=1 FL=1